MPQNFNFPGPRKLQIDSRPNPQIIHNMNPPTQSPLLNGINNLNSSRQIPLNLNMVIGKQNAQSSKYKKKRRLELKRKKNMKRIAEVRNLLGFQRNYPFSNKFFGQAYPKSIPDAMYFNPISQDIGGIPKLQFDSKSKVFYDETLFNKTK